MKKTAMILSKIAYCLGALILLGLTIGSFFTTYCTDIYNLDNAAVGKNRDSFLLNLLFLIVIGGLLFLLTRLLFKKVSEEDRPGRALLISAVLSGFLFVILMIWVILTQIEPYWDQAQVYIDALAFNKGDYSDMNYAYLRMYPQQYGLIFFESILLRIYPHFVTLQCFNALFISLGVFLTGRVVYLISKSPEASLTASLLTFLFAPFSYYVSFVYGDVFLAFSMLLITYLGLKWIKTGKWVFPISALIVLTVTIPVRENGLIFVIALSIVLLVTALGSGKYTYLFMVPFFILLPLLFNVCIHSYYEKQSGIEISENCIPTINWIAMGLQGEVESNEGVGYYNGYNYYAFQICGEDKEATIEYTREVLDEQLKGFKENPKNTLKFFLYKAGEQWLEPLFEAPQMTGSQLTEKNASLGKLLYSGLSLKIMSFFLNYLNAFIYLGAFIYTVYCIKHDKDFLSLILLVAFMGGFLFSLIWEAKGRYTMPFFILIIPLCAMGFINFTEVMKNLLKKKENLS